MTTSQRIACPTQDPSREKRNSEAGGPYDTTTETDARGSVGISAGADGVDGEFAARGGRPGTGQESPQSDDRLCRAQQSIAFDYDATLEVVTKDRQKLQLASSGTVSMARPDKIHTTRSGGFVDIETLFDGKTLTLFGKGKNVYTQVQVPGSLDNLMNELQKKYDRPLPAADLFLTRAYDEMTGGVTDVKDLGSGVVGGIECDYFAFRAKEVDWQIWVTQGATRVRAGTSLRPPESPTGRITVQLRNWKTGSDVATPDFAFKPPSDAKQISIDELKKLKDMGELPSHFILGGK